jgi:hypothetical protein
LVVGVELKGAEGANSAPLLKRFFITKKLNIYLIFIPRVE